VAHELKKERLIHTVLDDVVVRPGLGIGYGEDPVYGLYKADLLQGKVTLYVAYMVDVSQTQLLQEFLSIGFKVSVNTKNAEANRHIRAHGNKRTYIIQIRVHEPRGSHLIRRQEISHSV